MKRILSVLICTALLLCLLGCQADKPDYEQPVQLYYRTAPAENGISDSVIGAVTAEGAPYAGDPTAMLNEYLKGTGEAGFLTTFPASTKLLSLEIKDGAVHLLLNASIARLTGADLTVACACIAKTTMELTNTTAIHIRASGDTLDGAEEIVMTESSLILEDLYTPS